MRTLATPMIRPFARATTLALALVLLLPASSAAQEAAIDSLFAEWRAPGSPGCVVAVSRKGAPVFTKAYGLANLEHDVPMATGSVFQVASVSKQFTSALALMLVEQGKLSLTDDIRKHLPELPDYGNVITVDHLMRHTGGLREYQVAMQLAGWNLDSRILSNADVFEFVTRQRGVNRPPGQVFEYSNSGYILLATIVERASGTSLPELARVRIFEPLGMTSTRWRNDHRAVVKGRAIAYRKIGSDWVAYMDLANVYGSGGLLSTAGDLLTWNAALDAGRLGPFVTTELQREGVTGAGRPLGYARGLWINRYRGHREISHGGLSAGYQSTVLRYPDAGVSTIVLCNALQAITPTLAQRVADRFLSLAPVAAVAPVTARVDTVSLTPSALAAFAGTYLREDNNRLYTLAVDGATLRFNGGAMRPIGATRFLLDRDTIDFLAAGTMEARAADVVERYRRVDGPKSSIAELLMLQGRYASEETSTAYDVCVSGDGLVMRLADFVVGDRRLAPVGPGLFRWSGVTVRFERNGDGLAVMRFAGPAVHDMRFERVDATPTRCSAPR